MPTLIFVFNKIWLVCVPTC